jgi:hypothetical protein
MMDQYALTKGDSAVLLICKKATGRIIEVIIWKKLKHIKKSENYTQKVIAKLSTYSFLVIDISTMQTESLEK